ncbi:MAG: glycosyltransferase [Acidobacteriota bacterium]
MNLSVAICTHNPRPEYLQRALAALREQTLAMKDWELLLIDNASAEPLAGRFDLTWHPNARHVREEELGLTPARLRAIREADAELLMFIDDDNVLAPDYLETTLDIRARYPLVEVIGSGCIAGEFEVAPEKWMEPYLSSLALREVDRDLWSNDPQHMRWYPCGAGMCMTAKVAHAYASLCATDRRRQLLDRRGNSLVSGGDNDICYLAGSMGLGVGVFKALRLTHLIPATRLSETYLLRISEGIRLSDCLLIYIWRKQIPPRHTLRWYISLLRTNYRATPIQRRFVAAHVRAEKRAYKLIRELELSPGT